MEGWGKETRRGAQNNARRASEKPHQPPAPPSPPSPPPPLEIGGVQLLVEEGRRYTTDRLAAAAGSKIALGRVLAVKAGGAFRVGTPYVDGAVVEAEVVDDEAKGPKLTVFKFKNKSHYKVRRGGREGGGGRGGRRGAACVCV